MIFWIGILVAVALAFFAIRMGFYETWAILFNVVISIYLSVFVGPIVARIPAIANTSFSNALAVIATAIAAFLILQSITYILMTSQFSISFPKVLDVIGAGFLGFLGGLLLWSFVNFLIYLTPIPQSDFAEKFGYNSQFRQANVSVISWWCDLVGSIVSNRHDGTTTAEQTINGLFEDIVRKTKNAKAEQAPTGQSSEPDEPKTKIRPEDQLGPPPEIDFDHL